MIDIEHNKSIKPYNTFGIDVSTKLFTQFSSKKELIELLNEDFIKKEEKLILGGGSNMLFTKNYDGIILKNNIKGIEVIEENEDFVFIKSGAGEVWHEFVLFCIENGFGGVENLSLIPGSVGASPIQNIGAYGVEIKDVFHSLEAVNVSNLETKKFTNQECKFGYRESVFKNVFKDQFIITSVTYKLTKKPKFNISYGAINEELKLLNTTDLNTKNISNAIINIRTRKLPDPKEIGNAGSFFKNPVISDKKFEKLNEKYPEMAHYILPDNKVKIAAGWLIDSLGWKGKTFDTFGVHKNQALVLVNYGNGNGNDILDLSTKIMESVKKEYNIELEREVNIY